MDLDDKVLSRFCSSAEQMLTYFFISQFISIAILEKVTVGCAIIRLCDVLQQDVKLRRMHWHPR